MNTFLRIADLKARAAEIQRAGERMAEAAAAAEQAGLEQVGCHWVDLFNRQIPALTSFGATIGGKVTRDIEAMEAGRRSIGETNSAAWKRRRAKANKAKEQ